MLFPIFCFWMPVEDPVFSGDPVRHDREKLIGFKYIYDHFGRDVEETFENTNKIMKQSIIDAHNEYHNR